jgi:hypothetical protein
VFQGKELQYIEAFSTIVIHTTIRLVPHTMIDMTIFISVNHVMNIYIQYQKHSAICISI